jgi:hypothetical protein
MLDEESPKLWETKSGNLFAEAIVKKVLSRRPNAADCVTDCPWWAPLKTPDGHDTHPHAPTAIFGRLAAHDRYAQVYGAPVPGASTRMLEWARDPSQYPSLGTWDIRPAFQGYHRTVADHVQSLVSEPTSALWDYQELDANCIAALKLVAKFRATTFVTIQDFQKAYGLVDDGIVGPATLAALAAL